MTDMTKKSEEEHSALLNKKLPEGVDPKDIITKLVPRDFVGGSEDTGAWVFYQEGVFYKIMDDEDGQRIAIWHWTDGEDETDNDCDEIYKQKAKAGCLAWFATTEAAIRYAESLEVEVPDNVASAPSNIYVEDRTGIAWERTAHCRVVNPQPVTDWWID